MIHQNVIGSVRLEEILNGLLATAQMGGDIFTLDSLAVMWGIAPEFRKYCPERVGVKVVEQRPRVLEVVR